MKSCVESLTLGGYGGTEEALGYLDKTWRTRRSAKGGVGCGCLNVNTRLFLAVRI